MSKENMAEGTGSPESADQEKIVNFLTQIGRQRDLGQRQIEGPRQIEQIPDQPTDTSMEFFRVPTPQGFKHIEVPKTIIGKTEFAEGILGRVEQSATGIEDISIQNDLEKLGLFIREISTANYRNTHIEQQWIDNLVNEYTASINFYTAFGKFVGANDISGVQTAVNEVRSTTLNHFFNKPEFLRALNYYSTRGEYFTQKEKEGFQKKVQINLALREKYGDDEIDRLSSEELEKRVQMIDSSQEELDYKKYSRYQNLAERYWRMSGGRAMADVLGLDEKVEGDGKVKFSDGLGSGGDLQLRALLRFEDVLKTQSEANRPFHKLISGVNLQQKSYEQVLAEKVHKSIPNAVTGVTKDANGDDDFTNAKINYNTRVDGKFLLAHFDFMKGFDKVTPMEDWAFRNLYRPDGLRKAMIDTSGAYLRNPNEKTLEALDKELDYLGDDRWKVKVKLLENFIDFAKNERDTVTGRPKYSHDKLVAIVNDLSGFNDPNKAQFIQKRERKQLLDYISSNENILERVWNTTSVQFIFYFILGLIRNIFGQAMKDLK